MSAESEPWRKDLESAFRGEAKALCPCCRRVLDRGRCWKCHYRLCEKGCGRATGSAFLSLCILCEFGKDQGA